MIPDFEEIARRIVSEWRLQTPEGFVPLFSLTHELRLIWNRRGLADKQAVDVEAHRVYAEANRTGRTDLVVDLKGVLDALDADAAKRRERNQMTMLKVIHLRRLRMVLGIRLLRLAAFVIGLPIKVEIPGHAAE